MRETDEVNLFGLSKKLLIIFPYKNPLISGNESMNVYGYELNVVD